MNVSIQEILIENGKVIKSILNGSKPFNICESDMRALTALDLAVFFAKSGFLNESDKDIKPKAKSVWQRLKSLIFK